MCPSFGLLCLDPVCDTLAVHSLPRSLARSQHADVAVNKILIGNKCDMDEDREVREVKKR